MHISMINNLDIEELERHTQQLLDEGDYGPVGVATLKRWMDMKIDAGNIQQLEKHIKHLKRQLDKIQDLAADQ